MPIPDSPFTMHDRYAALAAAADVAHASGRSPLDVSAEQVALGRLYSYAFRGHTIGAFHATRVALEALPPAPGRGVEQVYRERAAELLGDLADMAMGLIGADARAVLWDFHQYDRGVRRVVAAMDSAMAAAGGRLPMAGSAPSPGTSPGPARGEGGPMHPPDTLPGVRDRFVAAINRITSCNGVYLARDDEAPEQASFIVPGLGITIVPLIYGDFHSWNLAWLTESTRDVPRHQHREAAEIHLGYTPIAGATIYGDCYAEVPEGYAMPIPPGTPHGYVNPTDLDHHVPFIYGSMKAGGWGVFFDVEPKPYDMADLDRVPLNSAKMNHSIYLEREIDQAAGSPAPRRYVIVDGQLTDANGSGGLEIAISRVPTGGLAMPADTYRVVSVVKGRGRVELADGITAEVAHHDHFGVPAGMACRLWQEGAEPMVVLDATIRPDPSKVDARLRTARRL